jgi:predicted RNase H-like nuclease
MKFLGIDLGWSTGASGLCCLEWQPSGLELLDVQSQTSVTDILAWVEFWLPQGQPGMIAVDAPTLIPNQTGMRLCDKLCHRYFGRYHAGCYPANQGLSFAKHTVAFGQSLEERGFAHAPVILPQQPGRYQIEAFPHAAMIYLFQLDQIIKYKKGKLADRRQGLGQLRQHILERLPHQQPRLNISTLPDIPRTGTALKTLEDQLDSLICAYIAAHWWTWGPARNLVLGGNDGNSAPPTHSDFLATGYIVVPTASSDPD